ncbi:unnamed protein product [Brachionus calyciflorus]|uniref:Exocyst complex component Sec8 n=1 Tax=Brachionus calyciflorus TaxID=104777 RepID=A0A814HFA8_9BILA|nr:unnamed protein product [Brachionus calyciflorus]
MNSSSKPTAELINIIKELFYNSSSGNTDERDKIIKKVDVQYAECDARIDKYIRNSSKDLSRLIKVFNDIAKKIEASRSNVSHSREALKQCKILLQSKRDDVRRLWLEWCEQKCYYNNLAKLKQIYMASENIRIYCNDKKYLEAAQLISECSQMIEKDFNEVNGLHDIKRVIDDERIKLEKYLFQELIDQLYLTVTRSVLETGTIQPTREASFRRRFRHHHHNNEDSLEENFISGSKALTNEAMIEKIVQAAAKLNNSETNINILEKMINDVNKSIMSNLIQMVNSTSTHVVESNLIDNTKLNRQSIENNPKFLCQLIELSYEQFKIAARLYKNFIEFTSKVNQSRSYQFNFIWTCIQNVLVQLLEEYLDIKQSGQSSQNQDDLENIDINSFFARKRLINLPFTTDSQASGTNTANQSNQISDDASKHRMFTFKGSSHAMSITNYIREKNNEDLFSTMDSSDLSNKLKSNLKQRVFKILVCQPDLKNITSIFSTMEHLIKEINDEIRMLPNMGASGDSTQITSIQKTENILEKFLQDYILNTFITNAVESIKEKSRIQSTTDGKFEISKQLISLQVQKELGLNKPILLNIHHVYLSCLDLFNLIKDMGSYASEFTRAMYSLIEKHTQYCKDLFMNIVTTNSGDGYVYSMFWVQDDGIKQYFKQLPAFSAAIKNKPPPAAQLTGARNSNLNNVAISTTTTNLNSQNPAVLAAQVEVNQFEVDLLSKEVETLTANLSDKELEEVAIITNFNFIEMIAHLHESCDWIIIQLKQILNSLELMIRNPQSLNNSLSIGELNRLTKQLEDLDKWRGDTLLLLYLETRVHCFYHLINFIKQENITSYTGDVDTDPDESVLNMNRDLHRIYEHLSRSLQDSKVNYVFDALGSMIATIFIKAVKNFKKISSHGIAKMCRNIFHVEQNLSAIRAKSDPHLMKAHRFYELLYKKPEELLNHLIEHEAEFQANDYINLLNLIYRSQPGNEINSLSDNIQSLNNILKNKH